jgi:hypothetical protein
LALGGETHDSRKRSVVPRGQDRDRRKAAAPPRKSQQPAQPHPNSAIVTPAMIDIDMLLVLIAMNRDMRRDE